MHDKQEEGLMARLDTIIQLLCVQSKQTEALNEKFDQLLWLQKQR